MKLHRLKILIFLHLQHFPMKSRGWRSTICKWGGVNILGPKHTFIGEDVIFDTNYPKDITLIFCISPYYKRSDFKEYKPLFEIAGRNNIPVLDYITDSAICTDPSLFSDGTHLNKAGAEKYSRIVVSDIKGLLNSGRHEDFDSID